jgi:7SK snRNA methylphosphate capping enzyme
MSESPPNSSSVGKTATYGNYKGYYGMREQSSHERISCFPASWFKSKRCIDIGCNSGEVTIAIASTYQPKSIVGVDLDPEMIESANKKLAKKVLHGKSASTFLIPRCIAVVKTETNAYFPKNVSFIVGDLMKSIEIDQYDTVLCLSVVKWIHLNFGDEGLIACFRKLWNMAKPGGKIILEYQTWKSYKNNCSKSAVMKANFDSIAIRPEDFERVLKNDIGFEVEAKLGTPLEHASGFNRPILVLRKPADVQTLPLADVDIECTMDSDSAVRYSHSHIEGVLAESSIGRQDRKRIFDGNQGKIKKKKLSRENESDETKL